MSTDHDDTHVTPRTLADATILQIVPALREEPVARTALNVAPVLLQSGARALIAAEDGPLAAELKALGGELVPLVNATVNPFRLRRGARVAGSSDRVRADRHRACAKRRRGLDRQHGGGADRGLARHHAARRAGGAGPARLLGRRARARRPRDHAVELRRRAGHRPLRSAAPTGSRSFRAASTPPHSIRPPSSPERVEALRNAWRIPQDARIVLVPGRVAPWNGQLILPEVARALLDDGVRGFVFVLAGEHRSFDKYARSVPKRRRPKGVQALIRLTGHCRDMPAAFAAADTVVVPAIEPPVLGRAVAQAQAMGRPVVTSNVGILPEHVVTPPEMPEDVRTGWVAKAGDATEFARALTAAFALDDTAYRAMCARARQFAQYMFSPESVAVATLAVYGSLLERDE